MSRLAVWSFVCGTFFFLPPMGIAAIVLSTMARRAIWRSQGRLVGYRLAKAGYGMGVASIVFAAAVVLGNALLPLFNPAKDMPPALGCRGNLKQVGLAIWMYQDDHTIGNLYYMPPDMRTLVENGYLKVGPENLGVLWCPAAYNRRSNSPWGPLPDPDRDSDYVYARLAEPASAPKDAPIMWDEYRHMHRPFWRWRSRPTRGVNVLLADLSTRWMPWEDFTAAVARYRPLYESEPPLPVVGGEPAAGWNKIEYMAAAAVALYLALIVVALARPRWLYALLPDRPGDAVIEGTPQEQQEAADDYSA